MHKVSYVLRSTIYPVFSYLIFVGPLGLHDSYPNESPTIRNNFMSINESILDCVIHDAHLKGATVHSWSRSQNGRIIIHDTRKLPLYFINIAWAIDALIHSYNLRTKYKHLYENIVISSKYLHAHKATIIDDTSIMKAIKACDVILMHDESEFLISNQHKVYSAIQKAHHSKPFEYGEYVLMRNSFLEHYTALAENAPNKRKQEHLKRVSQFFQEMTFIDINEMM